MQGYHFTERVRKALAMAREEAVRLRHQEVQTQHLLFALLRDDSSVARSVEEIIRFGPEPYEPRSDLPYSTRAKHVLELAMAEARVLNHSYVGTQHLLLGLIHEQKGVAAQALAGFGITLDPARQRVVQVLAAGQQDAGLNFPATGPTSMAASILEVLLRDAAVAGVFAAQGIDPWVLLAALRAA
jgi:ATP-dependent Clp protease ATP-binding subunit ClpC